MVAQVTKTFYLRSLPMSTFFDNGNTIKVATKMYHIVAKRSIYSSCSHCTIWEESPKGSMKYDKEERPLDFKSIREGFRQLRPEFSKWVEETKSAYRMDHLYAPEDEVVYKELEFNGPESLSNWVVSSDSDHKEGFSSAQLTVTPIGCARFSGTLSTRIPKDGIVRSAGYCNMKSYPLQKSFKRNTTYQWAQHTHLVLCVRGDGRSYGVNLHTPGFYDIFWLDLFSYPLFTRGGPYWQITKIPFSKFIQQHKGRVQDKQYNLPREDVSSVSITIADKVEGPFSLEIAFIGVEYNPNFEEDCSNYESHHYKHHISN